MCLSPVFFGLLDFVEPRELIEAFGTIGLFFGFFLPGDSLLFVAGLLNSQGVISLPLPLLLLGLFVAAVAGDQVGYSFGRVTGPPLFRRPDSRLFKRQHLERAH